jgi:hypothetical protein
VATSGNLPLVSTTLAATFATGVNDTSGKFAADVNNTGGNLPKMYL